MSFSSSCRMSPMSVTPKSSLILRRNQFLIAYSAGFRFLLAPKHRFTVSASVNTLLASSNMIAIAASGGSSSVHGAVSSAITQVAVTAVAIASGACLSTKVECLWPKLDEQPGSHVLDGVDVTGYPIFYDEKVQKAIAFARRAHHGQIRKTGDPYVSHCINTGRILAVLVPSKGKRAVDTVVAGILHDVVDDARETLHGIEQEFDSDVAKLVAGVSKLSYVNQLLRRHRRLNVSQATLSHEEADSLRAMLLGMVDDPRVVLIKLADRLHNMRTIYALPPFKAQAVAQETLTIWCSLASRLGLWALKAELEDLCFAVIQPNVFRQLRAELASMWNPSLKSSVSRRINGKLTGSVHTQEPVEQDEKAINMKVLLQAVLPFDLSLDRKKRLNYFNNLTMCSDFSKKPKVVRDAGIALASLVVCEEALERELFISTSYIPGMEVTLYGRLKSLYSIYSKMRRKDVGLEKVYDARALRVVVGDKNGALHGQAVQTCYSFLNIIHRLWTPTDGELDDYIVNPKPSGYQSLHTAVQGPDSSPLEVQIRTQRMHDYAEHGLAAHWLYKETENVLPSKIFVTDAETIASDFPVELQGQNSIVPDLLVKYKSLKAGHPVLRVEEGHLLPAVIVRVENDGRELLVAASFCLPADEVAGRRSSFQIKRWESYASLYKKVSDEWWFEPGHGDWCICLEKYTLCRDGIYHKQDRFQRLQRTFIQIIELTEWEENEYWATISAYFEGNTTSHIVSKSNLETDAPNSSLVENGMNNKVQLLRTMLQWEEQLFSEAGFRQKHKMDKFGGSGEVAIVCWPNGEIMRLRSGSTAADAARRIGLDGTFVSINGLLALPGTELKDGDVVEVRL